MKYWFTKQSPHVLLGIKTAGAWVRLGKEWKSDGLEPGDLICISEYSSFHFAVSTNRDIE